MRALALIGTTGAVVALVALRGDVRAPSTRRRPDGGTRVVLPRVPHWFRQIAGPDGPIAPELAWAGACVLGPALLVAVVLVAGPLPVAVIALAAAAAPRLARPVVERRRRDRRDAQLPAALERLASSLRAGAAPTAAFVALAAATPPPLGAALRVPAAEIEHGAPMAAAIDRWAGGNGASPAVQLAASALGLGVDTGGQVARSMDRVAATLRERRELQAEVHALATQARASAAVLALAPLAFTALVSTIEPGMVRFLVTTPVGALCLVAGLGLEAAGAAWMARITSSAS